MWDELSNPWQACLELAREAYCNDCYPIGAVVTDEGGKILTRGRNRIYENRTRRCCERGDELAHAEVEALRTLDLRSIDPHTHILYTTTEPCPMCIGTFYMSGLRTLEYAARDPWAGSVGMLGKTWYLSQKPIKIIGPSEPVMENIIVALFVEQDCSFHQGGLPDGDYYKRLEGVVGEGIAFGRQLWQMGDLHRLRAAVAPAKEMFNRLAFLVK